MQTLDQLPLSALKGAGAATVARLEKLGVSSVFDLLLHVPLRYEDRSRLTPLGALQAGTSAKICGQVQVTEITRGGRRSLVCRLADGTGHVFLRFFHFNARQFEQLARGSWVSAFGEVRQGFYGLEITHPEYRVRAEREEPGAEEGRLTPVYPLTEGVRQQTLRRLVEQSLPLLDDPRRLPDGLPEALRREFGLPDLGDALRTLHLPPVEGSGGGAAEQARRRLVFEELLAHRLSLALRREGMRRQRAPRLEASPALLADFAARLPFELTSAQRRVSGEIAADLARDRPMLRLVQGDVGSGKTVVAAGAALQALNAGWQVALMAPTEFLAEQHFQSLSAWLEPLGARLACLTGRSKGTARRKALEDLAAGHAGIAVGTHALFQDEVRFARLGLAIVDEQHRFGVRQRLSLRDKGEGGLVPHQLVMTATPIPRTLAMLGYADLDVSVIGELPPGRTPVTTAVLPAGRRDEVMTRIRRWVQSGRQAYWVCTLIEESEALECEAAEKTAARLAETLAGLRVGLAHGRMKPADKEAVMAAFKGGELDLLVATTVIEVGVDVPNAGLMVIDNAERLGLAQLHQLRGRVGRGPGESHCLLLYQPPLSHLARERLGLLRETCDGFRIAEKDLELRGPGEVLGTRQTGQLQFRVADLSRDRGLLDAIQTAARRLLKDEPRVVKPLIARWLRGAVRYGEA